MKVKVKEFIIGDGIGAQIWRKVYAMAYAKYYNLDFQDTPITDFLIHESDRIRTKEEKEKMIMDFLSIIKNPWSDMNFDKEDEYVLCDAVGAGLPSSQGISHNRDFIKAATYFNNITDCDNSIVIHLRRGNVIKENPRWIEEDVYINIFKNINLIVKHFNMKNPEVIILTDAPDEDKPYTPVDDYQKSLWNQPYLYADEDGAYITKSFNFDALRKEFPGLKVVNKLNTFDSFLLMLKANVLVVSRSAFSQSAGMLSHNNVIDMFSCTNGFANSKGYVDNHGNISFYK
jgi:hypothetical protein